jgi:hypothetical protein
MPRKNGSKVLNNKKHKMSSIVDEKNTSKRAMAVHKKNKK